MNRKTCNFIQRIELLSCTKELNASTDSTSVNQIKIKWKRKQLLKIVLILAKVISYKTKLRHSASTIELTLLSMNVITLGLVKSR